MTPARKQRLKEARKWWKEQHFDDSSHIVKAYKNRFNVDNTCAMRELVMLGVLSPEKQKNYQQILAVKDRKKVEKRERLAARKAAKESGLDMYDSDQDENFFFIAGYTPGGAPYGITWEEEAEFERLESIISQGENRLSVEDLPFD